MNVYAFIPLIATVAYIPLLVTTAGTKPWSRQHKLFLLYLIAAILWSLTDFFFRSNFFPEHNLILLKIILFMFTLMAVQFHCFTSSIFPSDKGRWLPLAYGSLAVVAAVIAAGYLPQGLDNQGDMLYPRYGWGVFILAAPLITLLLRNIVVMVPRLKRQENPVIYNQTGALLLSLAVLTVFVSAAILPFGREIPISHIGNIINAVILSYAVVGHQLVDIHLVLRRGLAWLSIALFSLVSYWVLVFLLHFLFGLNVTLNSVFTSSLAAIIVAVLIYRLRDTFSSAVSRVFQGSVYYYRQKLQDFSNRVHNIFSLKEQGDNLLKLLTLAVRCRRAALLFSEPVTEDFVVHLTEPKDSDNPLSRLRFRKDSPIVSYLRKEHRLLTAESLSIYPEFLALLPNEKNLLSESGVEIFVPLISRDNLIGMLALDRKINGIYNLEDFGLLEDVTSRVAVSMEKEYLREQLKEREEELSIINRSSTIFTSSLDIQRIYDTFIKELKKVIDVDWAAIAIIEEQELYFLALSSSVGSPWRVGERIPLKGTATEWVALHRKAVVDSDLSAETRFSTGKYHLQHNLRSIAYIPLLVSDNVIGSLIVASRKPQAYSQRHLRLLEQLASQIAMPVENTRLYARTERMARVDELTGLLNRRSLDEILPSEIGRHSRYGGIFSLVIMDMDSFKSFNDTYGHLVGDEILRQVGSIMKRTIRESDQAFRYGGDEFAILLPQTALDPAIKVAERVRQEISAQVRINALPITVSLGLASWPADGITPEEIIAAADTALYKAKKSGGNRIQCALGSLKPAAKEFSKSSLQDTGTISQIFALAAAVDARDHYTRTHSQQVHEYAMAIAAGLGLNSLESNRLGTCALLHDIGKIGISDEILNKQGKLTEQEWEAIKVHTYLGAAIASHSSQLAPCVSGILHHHERYDGTGYPDGLKGEEIPLEARILAIADSFAAMTHTRAHSKAISCEEAIEEIKRGAGTRYDPKLVEVFLKVIPRVLASQKKDEIGNEKSLPAFF